MLRRVRIKRLPQAKTGYQVRGSLYNDVPAMGGGADYNAYIGEPSLRASKYITAVPRDEANLEAEGGETVYGDINGDGMAEHKTIKGPRHSEGGVPLKLPDDSFIFSDTKSMRMKEPEFLAMFGKKSGSFTPADLAKQYDVEKYRKILQDPNSDMLDRKTAELMLKNFTLKLGALALAQESKKGFPQGIPAVAKPYMEAMGIKEEDVLPDKQISGTVDQLNQQQQQSNSDATMASPTEEQDEQYGPEAEEAQQMNSDRPVATPEPEVDEEAGMMPEEPQMQYGGMYADRNFAFQNGGWLPEEVAVFTGTVPYAEYGRALGANSQNYEGRRKNLFGASTFFRNGGYLPKADKGIEVDITGMTPEQKDRAYYEARKANPGKTINVIENGKAAGTLKYSRGYGSADGVDMATFGNTDNSVAAAAQYKILQDSLNDPDIAKKLCDETTASLKDKRSYKQKDRPGKPGKQGKTWEERGLTIPDCDKIKESFLKHQKRNLSFQGQNIDPRMFTDSGQGMASLDEIVSRKAINPETGKPITTREEAEKARKYLAKKFGSSPSAVDVSINEVSGKIGIGLDASTSERALQQATFHGYAHMVEHSNTYDKDLQYKMRNFLGELQAGVDDENSMTGLFSTKGVQISPIDDFTEPTKSYYGNTTAGHLAAAGLDKYDIEPIIPKEECQCTDSSKSGYKAPAADGSCPCDKKDKPKDCPCELPDGTTIYVGRDPNTGECNPCEKEVPVDIEQPAEWWLQDTIKTTGAFGDLMSIKKHMPWAPRVDLETPRPTFLDPTRELAANAEQANIQTQGMAQFAGPQALSSRSSSIQGQAAKNAADVLSRYNNANVNIANQFETQATNIRNQEQGMNQAASQRLYDQNTIANQQFDNSKMAMRNQLRNYYTNAITNRAKTDALNQLYPQYAVSPATGGFLRFKQGRGTTGQATDTGPDYWAERKKCVDAGASDPDACARNSVNSLKASSGGTSPNAAAAVNQMGYKKKGGYVYADVTYPFIL